MHPAQAIIDRIVQVLTESLTEHEDRIYPHRTLSLSDDHQELPAIVVTMGSDDPFGEYGTLDGQLGSLLSINVSLIDVHVDEVVLVNSLLDRRAAVHTALMQVGALALPFVREVGYLGAGAPITDANGTAVAKELTLRFQVAYTTNRFNPSV